MEENRQYISAVIGEEYKKWMRGSIVQITAPTGSGKSHFILHVLLPYAICTGTKILYFVNRKILKKQLEKELNGDLLFQLETDGKIPETSYFGGFDQYIRIETYQTIEQKVKNENINKVDNWLYSENPFYVVYDECHYFYSDSNFNTNTVLSFSYLTNRLNPCVQIFMSATMKNMFDPINGVFKSQNIANDCKQTVTITRGNHGVFSYTVPADYNYVRLRCFEKKDDIEQIIRKSHKNNEKWLVFIDSIEAGEKLRKGLIRKNDKNTENDQEGYEEKAVVLIDTNYKQDESANESVRQLSEDQYIDKAVVITTAVMDNGISFHDGALRNLVILADEEEEFIQMLGRKRKDTRSVNVYVCKRSIDHFKRRLRYIDRVWEIYARYSQYLNILDLYGMKLAVYCPNQQKILDDILNNRYLYDCIRNFCYAYNGALCINHFSISRIKALKKHYEWIIMELEKNDAAFIEEQAGWMGIPAEQIRECLLETEEYTANQYKQNIVEKIEELFRDETEVNLDTTGNKKLKNSILQSLRYFLKMFGCDNAESKPVWDNSTKKDRTISSENFNFCMTKIGLPYRMEKSGQSNYLVKKVEAVADNHVD